MMNYFQFCLLCSHPRSNSGKKNVKIFALICLCLSVFSSSGQAQIISTIAGNGTAGYSGDSSSALHCLLSNPWNSCVDRLGNVFIADQGNSVVREIEILNGNIYTVAGDHSTGYAGDSGLAIYASFYWPTSVAVDSAGNYYIVDSHENRIRMVDVSSGIVTTIGGNGSAGYSGDSGKAILATLNSPNDLAVNNSRDIFIADQNNHRIRKISHSTGIITTIAGNGNPGFSGDNGPAVSAELNYPAGVALDQSGNIYIADQFNERIREIDASTGFITTIAGNGQSGFSGDGGLATSARFSYPVDVSVDATGNIFVADFSNNRIRKINSVTGIITTVAGNGQSGLSGDGGLATVAKIGNPSGVTLDLAGDLFITQFNNHCVRKVSMSTGINELDIAHKIEVYPNPSNGTMMINIEAGDYSELKIMDLLGKVVFSKLLSSEQKSTLFEVSLQCPSGMYLVQLSSKDTSSIKKIIISR
jgi:hypothetical protein